MKIVLDTLRRFADYRTRSNRTEYWLFALAQYALMALAGILFTSGANGGNPLAAVLGVAVGLAFLCSIPASIALGVRRLHDINKSGWFLLLTLVPVVGILVVIPLLFFPGTPGDNQFGPVPQDD